MDIFSIFPAAAEIFVLLMAVLAILGDLFFSHRFKNISYYLVLVALIGGAVISFSPTGDDPVILFHGLYVNDIGSLLLKSFIYLTVFVTLIYSKHFVDSHEFPKAEYYILALFSTLGMLVLVSANSLLTIYLGLELLSLPLYAMVGLQRGDEINTEAALKYFVMGAIASGMLLYGMSMLYGATGTLVLPHIAETAQSIPADKQFILTIGMVFIVAGIGFKLAAAPFHMWAPDVYSGAPLSVTLFLSAAPKLAAYGMAFRLLAQALPGLHEQWQQILIIVSVLSMFVGNYFALVQEDIRRLLAYSAISHIGYMLLGFVAGTQEGYASALFYVLVYSLTSLAAFGMLLILAKDGFQPRSIYDLQGLNSRNPWLAFLMMIILFSLAGIPPTIGFFAKLWVFKAIINQGMVTLATAAILFAALGLFFYLRIIKIMYFDEPKTSAPLHYASDCRVVMSINSLALLALGILPTGLFRLCQLAFPVG